MSASSATGWPENTDATALPQDGGHPIAHCFGVEKAALTGLVDRAEPRGLTKRSPEPGDRRALRVTLTETGRRAAVAFHSEATAELEQLLSPLAPDDREHFHSAVGQIIAGCGSPSLGVLPDRDLPAMRSRGSRHPQPIRPIRVRARPPGAHRMRRQNNGRVDWYARRATPLAPVDYPALAYRSTDQAPCELLSSRAGPRTP